MTSIFFWLHYISTRSLVGRSILPELTASMSRWIFNEVARATDDSDLYTCTITRIYPSRSFKNAAGNSTMSLPPEIITVRRKRRAGADDGPVNFLRM